MSWNSYLINQFGDQQETYVDIFCLSIYHLNHFFLGTNHFCSQNVKKKHLNSTQYFSVLIQGWKNS